MKLTKKPTEFRKITQNNITTVFIRNAGFNFFIANWYYCYSGQR